MDNASSVSEAASSSVQRARVLWKSEAYNDEALLRAVLQSNPFATWAVICDRFNEAAPASRQRSLDAVTAKGKAIQRKERLNASTSEADIQTVLMSDTFNQISFHEPSVIYNL